MICNMHSMIDPTSLTATVLGREGDNAPYTQRHTMVHVCIISAYANKAGIQADQVTNCTLSRSYYYSRSADHITISLHQVTPDYRGKCSPPPSLRTRHYSMCMSKTFFRMMQGWQRQKPWKVYRCSVHARQWVLGLCKSFICHVMTDQWGAV